MKQAQTVKLALRAISMNKMRAFLMMLGVIIGITTLTVIVSVGKGASAKVMKTIQNFGPMRSWSSRAAGRSWAPLMKKSIR